MKPFAFRRSFWCAVLKVAAFLLGVAIVVTLAAMLTGCEYPPTPRPTPYPMTFTPAADTASPPPDTPGATVTASVTPTPTANPSPSPTPTANLAPPATPTPEIGPTVSPYAPNLLINGDFERYGAAREFCWDGECISHLVADSWQPFYCDEPYAPAKCEAPRRGSGNPPDLMMRRPEFKMATVADHPERVLAGFAAQQWFCFMGSCRAGVYQTIDTQIGQRCEAGAHVQTWSSKSGAPLSDQLTQDDRDNSMWFIRVNLTGKTFAFLDENLISRAFAFPDGHYDHYALISYPFIANSAQTTVFFENLRLWPITNNDSYIDDAYVRCQ